MNYPLGDVRDELEVNGLVLLDQVLEDAEQVCDQLQYLDVQKSYQPLQHSWSSLTSKELRKILMPVLVFLKEVADTGFEPELLVLEPGDYSVLNDETPTENGVVAFLDVSLGWHPDWGGYVAIDQQPIPLNPNNLLIAKMQDQRWFIKRINHYAEVKRVLVVFRSISL